VNEAFRAAGIGEEDGKKALSDARDGAWAAALRFAERRRIGPFAAVPADPAARHKATGAMLRAGHAYDVVRRLLNASPGEIPDSDGS
jgi:regulatory protein